MIQHEATSEDRDELYETLKRMAITFEFPPGARINEVALAREHNVSRTPLREALNRLHSEGYFSRAKGKGFVARHLVATEIYNLYEVRRMLETAGVRIACERAKDSEIQALHEFAQRSSEVPESIDPADLVTLDEEFHERLATLTGNAEYVRTLANINGRIRFARWIDMKDGRRSYTQNEHLEIIGAVANRDVEKAVHLVEHHIARRMDQVVDVIRRGVAEIYMRNQPVTADHS